MSSDASNISSFPHEQELVLPKNIDANQLDKIWERLDTISLALQAIANLTPQEILRVAKELNLESVIEEGRALWWLSRSDFESKTRNQQLEIKKARSLVLVICHLAQQHQELIRRAVNLLEQTTAENQPPQHITLLANYLDKFFKIYQENKDGISSEAISQLALKTLIDLLFYSGNNGHYLLWSVILEDSC